MTDTLESNELVWWYKVSDYIRFKECKTCVKRIGEDFQVGHKTLGMRICPKCPIGSHKTKHSTHRKQHGDDQTDRYKNEEVRWSLLLRTPIQTKDVFFEFGEDDCMSSDGELDQETQLTSPNPRRVGESDGEPVIISL